MEVARQALKKLNVFAQTLRKYPGKRHLLQGPSRYLNDGIFGVAMTLLILDGCRMILTSATVLAALTRRNSGVDQSLRRWVLIHERKTWTRTRFHNDSPHTS